ncbi:MAG: divalent-cation tolerance protein CutA [Betaproteobacteria bacterium]|nr:divalent-cation tolerance protein CutA [Betaproteobacteria bacterium]
MADAAILVLTSLPDLAAAQALSRALVTGRLAACVSIGAPVESIYHWQGEIETAREIPLAIKTRALLYPRVEAAIVAAHPYELPEVFAVPLTHGLPRYLEWIGAETGPA